MYGVCLCMRRKGEEDFPTDTGLSYFVQGDAASRLAPLVSATVAVVCPRCLDYCVLRRFGKDSRAARVKGGGGGQVNTPSPSLLAVLKEGQ